MNTVVLLLVIFLHAQPATATSPLVAEHAESKSYVLAGDAAGACDAAGQALVSQLKQNSLVAYAGYGCIPVKNPEDKAA